MATLPKDLINLVFLEFENGHDMLNFGEINRKYRQVFLQHIVLERKNIKVAMYNRQTIQKHGITRAWHDNGQLWYDHNYLNGMKHGTWYSWWSNGDISGVHNYFQNQRHGSYSSSYPYAKAPGHIYYYHLGKKHGTCRIWYSDQQIMSEINYYHGIKHGICREWKTNGQLASEVNYIHGIKQIEK